MHWTLFLMPQPSLNISSFRFILVPSEVHGFLYELVFMSYWHAVLKKDKTINQLTNDLQECMKELCVVKAILPKVFQDRYFMWEKVKSYSKMKILLNYEINMLKRKVDTLDEDFFMKEGQITMLKDSIGKPFDLLASPDSLLE
ncbi:hypothetical protein CQW23_30850 [Capsicum baccatum]|uniref:Uncharacterized protein n=1 Tax=Capsicum baccatum TaxID=33114 RepID=A0A2G2V9D4_CAPBA|nr:hypothetical protein CQW23_30850 [Capsicum baccatum]